MRTRDFNALNDLLFKYVFGKEERKALTLSFINAVLGLEGARAFVDLKFADRELDPELYDAKGAQLDLFCTMEDGTQVNIEVQVRDQHDIEQRSLFYWARLYQDPLLSGEDYQRLHRTVGINLLGYSALPQSDFHSVYGLYNIASGHRLTDDIEIHFIEMPKVPKKLPTDLRRMRMLEKWAAFLSNKLSDEEMEVLAMNEAVIGDAWAAMEDFLADRRRRIPYLQREKAERDRKYEMRYEKEHARAEGLAEGRAEGLAEGLAKGRTEGTLDAKKAIALNMLRAGTSAEQTARITELPLAEVQRLAGAHDRALS